MGVKQKVPEYKITSLSSQRASSRFVRNLDWVTVLLYFLLVALGWMNIYAAVYSPDNVVNILSFDINSGSSRITAP